MAITFKRSRLFYKVFIWFLLLSLAPLGAVGYHLIEVSRTALLKEIYGNQEALATGFADNVKKFVTTFKNVLVETVGIEEFASMQAAKQQQYLNRVMQVHMAILELSVFNASGMEVLRSGRYLGPSPEMRNMADDELFLGAMARDQHVGRLERFQDLYPTLNLSVAIIDQKAVPPKRVGVLAAKVSLNGLSTMLSMEFPQGGKSVAYVGALDGFLIAHSSAREVFKKGAKTNDKILASFRTFDGQKGTKDLELPDGKRLIATFADVGDLRWQVYVQQPLDAALQASEEMKGAIILVIAGLCLIVVLSALYVAFDITRPISVLRREAEKIRSELDNLDSLQAMGQDKDWLELMPNNEIGLFAETFQATREAVWEKHGEVKHAKTEVEKANQDLNKKVDAKTRELKAAHEELVKKERLAAIGSMASVVGHEIRNPLAVMNNSIYFIKTKLGADNGMDPKVGKHIKIIESEIQTANGIINQILDYSRTRELKLERVSLNEFLEELVSVYPFPPHIKLEKSFDAAGVMVDIDTTEVRQAVRNLIGNGIEVMPNGGSVRVNSRLDAGMALVEVGDTGSGIPPEVMHRIFEPFFTTKARGTGLGLAVVMKVLERHRGRVEVDSRVGQGTTFKLYLPLPADA